MGATGETKRERRVLAKPLSQGRVMRAAGETVELRPDQITRLEAEGYLEPAAGRAGPGKRPAAKE